MEDYTVHSHFQDKVNTDHAVIQLATMIKSRNVKSVKCFDTLHLKAGVARSDIDNILQDPNWPELPFSGLAKLRNWIKKSTRKASDFHRIG